VNTSKSGQRIVPDTPNQIASYAAQTRGNILIASSDRYQFPACSPNDKITGFPVECSNLEATLRGKLPDCPFVIPAPGSEVENLKSTRSAEQRLFIEVGNEQKALTHVAAGAPSYITLDSIEQKDLKPLAFFPRGCKARNGNANDSFSLNQKTAFAVGGDLIEPNNSLHFRFLAFASSKVFNNALLYLATADNPEDQTDNMELCFRTIDYLQGPNQQRKKCVFFENGRLIDHFDDLARATAGKTMPFPSINLGSLQKDLIDRGNSLLDGFQKEDTPNKIVNRLLPLRTLALTLFWVISISACFFMLRKLVGSRKPTNIPPAPTIAGATSEPPGVFERRQKELLRRNNVYEAVRDLVRDFFESVGIHGEPGAKHPKVQISKVVRKPDSLRLAIKDLWRLAYGPPQVVGVSQWRDLEPYFEKVRQAHEDGKWAFAL
jgi:hypothetical protein